MWRRDASLAVLAAVDSMEQDFGSRGRPIQLTIPCGENVGMLPGLFENGGYTAMPRASKILMDCKCGRGTKALETLKKSCPTAEEPVFRSGRTSCLYQLLFHESGILWEILSVLDNLAPPPGV